MAEEAGKHARSVTLKGKLAQTFKNENPGPGTYELELGAVREGSPSFKLTGKNSKGNLTTRDQLPGPGYYDPHLPTSSLAFSLKGKLPWFIKNDMPGPADYDPSPILTKYKAPAPDFSKGPDRPTIEREVILKELYIRQ